MRNTSHYNNISYDEKINMIKSQLKRFEIFQDEKRLFVKIPSQIDLDELDCKDEDILFHTVDEIEHENTISSDITILECDINKLDSKELLHLLIGLNRVYRKAYEV